MAITFNSTTNSNASFSHLGVRQFIILMRNIKAYRFSFAFRTFIQHELYYFTVIALIPTILGLLQIAPPQKFLKLVACTVRRFHATTANYCLMRRSRLFMLM